MYIIRERNSDWQDKAACSEADPELFFHPDGEKGVVRHRRAEAAKKICATCDVIEICREESLRRREVYGTWGGLSESDRQSILSGRLGRRAIVS